MTEEEADEAFRDLISILRKASLGWVADQVIDYISTGHQQSADVLVEDLVYLEEVTGIPRQPRRRRERMVHTVPYRHRRERHMVGR